MSQNCSSNLSHDVSNSTVTQNDTKSRLLTLPDVPLLRILQYVPLQSLIDLPLMYPRFLPLCDLVFKQHLKPNHRLLLYIGDLERIRKFKCSFRIGIPFVNYLLDANGMERFPDPEFDRLHYLTLDDETVNKLISSMPAISHLEVILSNVNLTVISSLIRLLTHWASTLKWFKLGCGAFSRQNSQPLLTLIGEINLKLSALEHLTLDLDGEPLTLHQYAELVDDGNLQPVRLYASDDDPRYLELPILGQLKEFYLQTRDKLYLHKFCNIIRRQASDQLTAIGLGLPFAWGHYHDTFSLCGHNPFDNIRLGNQPFGNRPVDNHLFAARFTLLSTRYEPPYLPTSFPNLKGYTAHWHLNQPLNSCTSKLVSLQQLQYLELRRVSHNGSVSIDSAVLSPLPSVEILRINFNNCFEFVNEDHDVLQDPHWASLFPSVQIVNLLHMGDFCTKCYPKEEEENCSDKPPGFEQTRERTACLSQLLAPLTVLPSLRKIFYQRNNDLKNIAEFTGKGEFVKTHAYIH